MGELRNVMLQYTKTADPTESEARKERMRQAEEQWDMEETAVQMVRASLTPQLETQHTLQNTTTPERIPVSQRLSGFGLIQTGGKDRVISASSTHERMPAILRLGSPPNPLMAMQNDLGSTHNLSNEERLPAILRLGPLPPPAGAETEAPNDVRRKPGRPPGKKKTTENQTRGVEEAPKKRRVTQQKPSPVRRKGSTTTVATGKKKTKAGPSRGGERASSTTSSENRPICNMIPATARKRMDFRIHSTPGP
ncbi:unnamed protein product [Brassica rapa subsp. trilocularis]